MSVPTVFTSSVERQEGYAEFEKLIAERGKSAIWPRFTTDADPDALWALYLDNLPEARRQHYNCHTCRRFIQHYGGLVTIDEHHRMVPVLWGSWGSQGIPHFFTPSVLALARYVESEKRRITGVFVSNEQVWGTPQAGLWSHLFCPNQAHNHPRNSLGRFDSAGQLMAEKKQEYIMLCKALTEIPLKAIEEAVRVLEADALDRNEKTLGVAKWFLELAKTRGVNAHTNFHRRDNRLWLAVANAPPGWCHVRSTMIGTLLDDIIAGLPYEEVARRWASKMHPLRYQRPTALKEGAIKQAEELVAKLGTSGALERRFAKLEDVIQCNPVYIAGGIDGGSPKDAVFTEGRRGMWMPSSPKQEVLESISRGVFGDLKPTKTKWGEEFKRLDLPARDIRWTKFREEVLPTALTMKVYVEHGRQNFYGLVTAANEDAPPILQWDGLTQEVEKEVVFPDSMCSMPDGVEIVPLPRNPVSWYVYHGGSVPGQWGLTAGTCVNVAAVFGSPAHWQKPGQFRHHTEAAMFALEGCKDLQYEKGGLFFPELLRSEYHGVRQVMEAYSQNHSVAGKEEGNANGLLFSENGGPCDLLLQVTVEAGVATYRITSWD